MPDHMTMPVLFAILIGPLAAVTIGVVLALGIVGERSARPLTKRPSRRIVGADGWT